MKKTVLTFIVALVSMSLFAQANYNDAIKQGDAALQQADYTTAIRKYIVAMNMPNSNIQAVREKLDKVYVKINETKTKLSQTEIDLTNTKIKLRQTEADLTNTNTKTRLNQTETKTKLSQTETDLTNTKAKLSEVETELYDTQIKLKQTEIALDEASKVINELRKKESKPQPRPVKWNDFNRLYEKPSSQYFLSVTYGMNTVNNVAYKDSIVNIDGNNVGLIFGSRHGISEGVGIGHQASIGLGFNDSGSYLHWSIGEKFYPWNCLFISANYGAVSMKKYNIEKTTISKDGQFTYYKDESQKFYHGFSLLAGADICFGSNTTDKCGGIVNIAIGTVFTEGQWGFTLNLGIGLVFGK